MRRLQKDIIIYLNYLKEQIGELRPDFETDEIEYENVCKLLDEEIKKFTKG